MKSNVYYELSNSPFNFKISHFLFVFSSKLYLDKFKETYEDYIKKENLKFVVRYKGIIDSSDLLLLTLYQKIEKRGFKVFYKGYEIEKDYFIDFNLNLDYSKIKEN